MQIVNAVWDSNFFGYSVNKLIISKDEEPDLNLIIANNSRLLYIFSDKKIDDYYLQKMNGQLVDVKINLIKSISGNLINPEITDNIVQIIKINKSIIALALQSGIYSRFVMDPNFKKGEFERLYNHWIIKSVARDLAEEVIGYKMNNKIIGLMTIGMKNSMPDIGLFAVDFPFRGMSVGKELLKYISVYAKENNYDQISVTTQEANLAAMEFYRKNGFEVSKKTFIYHIWK